MTHALLALLPIVAFWWVESTAGLGPAVGASLLAAIPSLAWTWRTRGRLDRLTLGALALAALLGGASVLSDDPRFVLWSPAIGSAVMTAALGGALALGREPLAAAVQEADPDTPLSDEERAWLRGLSLRLTGVFALQVGLFAWSTTRPRETWVAVTGVGGWLLLGAWLGAEALWSRYGPRSD